jgi:hypothetical protein
MERLGIYQKVRLSVKQSSGISIKHHFEVVNVYTAYNSVLPSLSVTTITDIFGNHLLTAYSDNIKTLTLENPITLTQALNWVK